MIKRTIFLSLFSWTAFCGEPEVKKHELENGIDVVAHENFCMPSAIVGIIFHAGSFDAPTRKRGITDLIAANLISKEARAKLAELGISCEVNVRGRYTEILAKINPSRAKEFFRIIFNDNFSPTDFEILKRQIVIEQKLAHNCFEDVVPNEISANIKYKNANIDGAFNEKAFMSISLDDANDHFERYYKKRRVSVVASGAISLDDLVEAARSTTFAMQPRESTFKDFRAAADSSFKEITIASKHVGRTVRYFYKIPKEDLAVADAFFDVLDCELFNFFEKASPTVSHFDSFNAIANGDCVREIVLYPKSDVALADLQKAYEVFVDKICGGKISEDVLADAKKLKDYSKRFLAGDLVAVYSKIKNDRLNGLDKEVEIDDPKQFNSLGEKFLKENLILKIVTRYKQDK
jgi:predicted Zn-dependent peptidase